MENEQLLEKMRSGDKKARKEFIANHLYLIDELEAEYLSSFAKEDLGDLEGEAQLYLTLSADKFEGEYIAFVPFAKHAILEGLLEHMCREFAYFQGQGNNRISSLFLISIKKVLDNIDNDEENYEVKVKSLGAKNEII
jgi:hypothetical protein